MRSSLDFADARQGEYAARQPCGGATMSQAQYTQGGFKPPVEARAFDSDLNLSGGLVRSVCLPGR
jgi:hypothetical protein